MSIKQQIDHFLVTNSDGRYCGYLYEGLKETFQHRIFDNHLFVFNLSMDGLWMDFAFFQYSGCEITDDDKEVNHTGELFWYGNGPLGSLKELRHSYFPEYIFYASPAFMKKCCDIILEYYEE